MIIAGSLSLDAVLTTLATERPVFHSEADLHQAFAWTIRTLDATLRIRLETRPMAGVRLDLMVLGEDGVASAIELKYLTRAWTGDVDGERFELKSQGAQDIRAYDVVKDIERVETFTGLTDRCNGAVVCLANDPYWRAPTALRDTNAAAFRLYEGVELSGSRAWGLRTGAGTMRGREKSLELRGRYELHWQSYSTLPSPRTEFRALVIEVPRPA